MSTLFSTAGLARASARHPWRILSLWVALIAVAVVLASGLGSALNNAVGFTNDPESERAATLLEDRLRGEQPLTETVVFRSERYRVDDPAFRAVVDGTTADLAAMDGVVASVSNVYQLESAGDPAAAQLVSADRHATIIPVTLAGAYGDLADHASAYLETAQAGHGGDFAVYSVGDLSGSEVYGKIAEEDFNRELFGLPIALLVLIVVFGALVAATMPVVLGLVSIVVATGLTAIAAQFIAIDDIVSVMISVIGLAVGIDYALFVIERYREERRHGLAKDEAISLAGGTAGKAVLFSGGAVVLALLGMFLIPISIFHSLATGAVLAVLVAVFATQTLVPALLGLLGDKINWPRRRRLAAVAIERRYAEDTIRGGFWARITHAVMARPVVALVLALAVLVGAALPLVNLETGQPGMETMPASTVKSGYEILARDFYAGEIAPVEIVVDGNADDPRVVAGIAALTETLAADPATFGPSRVEHNAAGDVTLVSVPMRVDPNSRQAEATIGKLRNEVVPAAFGEIADNVYVGGDSAASADFNAALDDYTPLVFAFVLGLSFLLLAVAFHSLVVPLKAIPMNLLSVGAAYGLLVLVFQKGIGAELFGFVRSENISAWIPIFLFSVLFGLSMDYHVFLLSRIKEHFDLTGRNAESVAVGLQATARIITGAALIMVAVFGAFATGRLVEFQQVGFGLAVAIFLDATIVRSVLVPAAMKLLGGWNWYLPAWLDWLPDLRIEGTPDISPEMRREGAPSPAPSPTPPAAW